MSKRRLHLILKLISFFILFVLLCGFQTSFWPMLITFLPPPPLWLVLIVFISMQWKADWTLFYIYFLGLTLTRFTAMPLKMALWSLFSIYCVIWVIRNRIHSSGLFAYATLSAVSTFLYGLSYIIISYLLEQRPTHFFVIHRLTEVGLIFVFSFPLFLFLDWFDRLFKINEDWKDSKGFSTSTEEA